MANAQYILVVTHTHGDYTRGDMVTDPAAIQALLADHPHWVVQVQVANPN